MDTKLDNRDDLLIESYSYGMVSNTGINSTIIYTAQDRRALGNTPLVLSTYATPEKAGVIIPLESGGLDESWL